MCIVLVLNVFMGTFMVNANSEDDALEIETSDELSEVLNELSDEDETAVLDVDSSEDSKRLRSSINMEIWDGSLDFTWYDETNRKDEYHISTPAEWAALAWICSEDLFYLEGEFNITTKGNITDIIGTIPTEQFNFEGVTIYLENDLNMGGVYNERTGKWSGPNYYPIGGQYRNDGYTHAQNQDIFFAIFYGSFDGQGHTVSNIYCDRGWSTSDNSTAGWFQSAGLFGRVGAPDTTSHSERPKNDIIIENVAVTGFIETSRSVGGIVGKTLHVAEGYDIIIRNCLNYATIANSDKKGVGGIVGSAYNGCYIINCANFGKVICGMQNGGGISGSSEAICISCYNAGDISESKYNHGQAYGTDNGGTKLLNFYYASDSVVDAGYPAIYSGGLSGADLEEKFDFTAIASEDMTTQIFADRLNRYADEYGYWMIIEGEYDGYPVPEVFGGGYVEPPSKDVETYVVELKGEDHYSVTLDEGTLAYRSGSIFSIDSDQTRTLNIKTDEDFAIKEVTQNNGAGVARLRKVSEGVYELSDVVDDVVITVETEYGCTHKWKETERKDATCTEAGYANYICEKCEETMIETLPAGNHSYNKHTVRPTETERGYTEHVCSSCGDTYKSDYTWLVTFDSAGGSAVTSKVVAEGSSVTRPTDPVNENGKTFAGWYADVEKTALYDFDKPVTGSFTLYADWADTAYQIAFKGEHADAVISGISVPGAVVRDENGKLTFSVDVENGYELAEVSAKAISPDNVWDGTIAEGFAGGKGIKSDPYLISNASELAYLAKIVNENTGGNEYTNVSYGKYYKLTASIDLNNIEWTPIGDGLNSKAYSFYGNFDGDGHMIANLYIDQPEKNGQGLFGSVYTYYEKYGIINNLTVTGKVTGKNAVGGIVGKLCCGTLDNCVSYVDVIGKGYSLGAGGLVGYLTWFNSSGQQPTISNCKNYGSVSGFHAGGLAGFSIAACIENSLNYGTVSGSYNAGGIVGSINTAEFRPSDKETIISECGNYGAVNGTAINTRAGGVVASLNGGGTGASNAYTAYVHSCFNVGNVVNQGTHTGGIVGIIPEIKVEIKDCFNTGNVSSYSAIVHYVGGIAGKTEGTRNIVIKNCYHAGTTEIGSGSASRGAIVGMLDYYSDINNTYWYGDVAKAWNNYDYSMSENAVRLSSEVDLKNLAASLGSAYTADNENINGGMPVLTWQKAESAETDAEDAVLTDNGDGSYTLSNITSDMIIYILTQKQVYPVTFVTEYGRAPVTQNIEFGGLITEPQLTFEGNYRFDGWYSDEGLTEKYDFSTAVTGPVILYAKWVFKYYTVDFRYTYDTLVPQQMIGGEDWPEDAAWKAVRPSDPKREGYKFTGWYTDRTCKTLYDFESEVTEDLILYAGWEAGAYSVTIDPDNGTEPEIKNIAYGGYVNKPGTDPEKEGFVFAGWYLEKDGELTSQFYFSTTVVKENLVIKAKWADSVNVVFDVEPENADVRVSYNGLLTGSEEDGTYVLGAGMTYQYKISAEGYYSAESVFVPEISSESVGEDEDDENGENGETGEGNENGEDSEGGNTGNAENTGNDGNDTDNSDVVSGAVVDETGDSEGDLLPENTMIISVSLEPLEDLTVSFEGDASVSVNGTEVEQTKVGYNEDLKFTVSPEEGKMISNIKIETAESEDEQKYASVWDGETADADWQGGGTEKNPYLITDAAQLAGLAYMVNDEENDFANKYFKLMEDIDLGSWDWTPVGGNGGAYRSFQGVFDGNGHTIYNLKVNGELSYVGLFGYLKNATVKNLNIDSADVKGRSYVGIIAGLASDECNIMNCSVGGSVKGSHVYNTNLQNNYSRIGGIAGSFDGTMEGCVNNAYVTGDYGAGGLIGTAENSSVSISDCVNNGRVNGSRYIGGIAGLTDTSAESVIMRSGSCGDIYGGEDTGGMLGRAVNARMEECFSCGYVRGSDRVGGIAGAIDESSISDSYSSGNIAFNAAADNESCIGGIAGELLNASGISNCYSSSEFEGSESAKDAVKGGIAGQVKGNSSVKKCYWDKKNAENAAGKKLAGTISAESLYDYQMKDESFVVKLGAAFAKDVMAQNGGLPVLGCQNTLDITETNGKWTVTLKNITDDTVVTVNSVDAGYYVTWDESEGYTVNAMDELSLLEGEDFNFTVKLNPGYAESPEGLVVTANGNELTPSNGIYTIENICENQIIKITGWETGTYTVTFDANGGTMSGQKSYRVTYPSKVTEPSEDPVWEGTENYKFIGWYLDKDYVEKFDFNTSVTKDITLYAGWYAENGMYIKYDLNLPSGATATGSYAGLTEFSKLETQGKKLANSIDEPTCSYRTGKVSAKFLYWVDASGKEVDLDKYVVPELSEQEMLAYKMTLTLPETTLKAMWKVSTESSIINKTHYISTASEFHDLADAVNSGHVSSDGMVWILENDIKLKESVTIGSEQNPFNGILIGAAEDISEVEEGEEVSCYTITLASGQTGGLFGCIGSSASVQYVNVTGDVEGDGTGPVGIIANISYGNITGGTVRGSVSGKSRVGGVVGLNYANLTDIKSYANVTGFEKVGGIAGQSGKLENSSGSRKNTVIENCKMLSGGSINVLAKESIGNIKGEGDNGYIVGGIAGYSVGTIKKCENGAAITYSSSTRPYNVGGISGEHYGNTIEQCVNSSDIKGSLNVGGIIGLLYPESQANISDCKNTGNLNVGGYSIGGILGCCAGEGKVLFRSCLNTGEINNSEGYNSEGNSYIAHTGGIVGKVYDSVNMSYCYNQGDMNVQFDYTGGLVGSCVECNISYCYSVGKMNVINAQRYVGGLVGKLTNGNIANCYWYGDEFIVSSDNTTAGYADGENNTIVKNFYYCNDPETLGKINEPKGEKVDGRPASAFKSGEVSYLIDLGDVEGKISNRDKKWSLTDEKNTALNDRYPVIGVPEYYMVSLTAGSGGSASLEKIGGDVSQSRVYAGRTHLVKINAVPSDEVKVVTTDKSKITYYWVVDKVNATFVKNADGTSGEETVSSSGGNVYSFTVNEEGNYKVNVTFKQEMKEEPLDKEEPAEDNDSGTGSGNGHGSGSGNGNGNGDGSGSGNGSGNGVGDGDNGSGNEAGGGDGGRGDKNTTTEQTSPDSGEQTDAEANVNTAELDVKAETEKGDRSDVDNNTNGEKGGSEEGGDGNNPDTIPNIFEVLKDIEPTQIKWLMFIILLMIAIAVTAAVRRYKKYHDEQSFDSKDKKKK